MANIQIRELKDKDILKKAQKGRNVTQTMLAGWIGVSQNALSQSMNRPRMSLEMFSKILDALDYDVVITDRETGDAVWKLEVERPEAYMDDDI